MKISCKELRELLLKEWQRFTHYDVKGVENFIRRNFDCSEYAVKTLAREFAGRK